MKRKREDEERVGALLQSGLVHPTGSDEYQERVKAQHSDHRNVFMRVAATTEWGTPPALFAALDKLFGPFTLDAAASDTNHKCEKYYTLENNGLHKNWRGHTVWVNPPYGAGALNLWVRKAYNSTLNGTPLVVMLIPVRSCTTWWADVVAKHCTEVWIMRGRLRFHLFANGVDEGPAKSTTNFDSCLLVFDGKRGGPPAYRMIDSKGNVLKTNDKPV
jgi:site-specific DNA-methyltransferase (adenine-specific)